jgi:hypothetical protein
VDETIGKLFDRYGYTFCHTDYIGKFKVDEAYIFGFDGFQYVFTFGLILLLCHGYISCFVSSIGSMCLMLELLSLHFLLQVRNIITD